MLCIFFSSLLFADSNFYVLYLPITPPSFYHLVLKPLVELNYAWFNLRLPLVNSACSYIKTFAQALLNLIWPELRWAQSQNIHNITTYSGSRELTKKTISKGHFFVGHPVWWCFIDDRSMMRIHWWCCSINDNGRLMMMISHNEL